MMIYSDQILSKRLERTEACANVSFIESRAKLSPESGAEWIEVAGAYAMFDGVHSPCTQTFGLGMFGEVTSADLEAIETFFKERMAPVMHEICPLADSSLFPLLRARGYQPIENSNVLYLSLEPLQKNLSQNPSVEIRVVDQQGIPLWAETCAKGWASEMPDAFDFMYDFAFTSANAENCTPFLAEIKGKPIATSALYIFDGVAVIAGTSTIFEERKQGAQTALIQAHLHFAREKGCDLVIMAASPGSQSQKNAEKNQFRIAYTRTKWQLF